MLTCLAFHEGDKHIAVQLAEWIRDLGGVSKHELMLVLMKQMNPSGVVEPLQEAFKKVFLLRVNDKDPGHWPESANLMFKRAARQIEATSPQPWLWLEPDAIPLSPTWLDELAADHKSAPPGSPFMGALVNLPGIIPHMSGVAVYPGNAPTLASLLVQSNRVAFDVNSQSEVLPRLTKTELIQHDWKPATFATAEDLARIRPGAAIYHQCKDGSLIARLREARGTTPPLLLPSDKGELADIGEIAGNSESRVDPYGAEVPPPTSEEMIAHYVSKLAELAAKDRGSLRLTTTYLGAAGLLFPLTKQNGVMAGAKKKPKGKPGRPKKQLAPSPATTTQQPEVQP